MGESWNLIFNYTFPFHMTKPCHFVNQVGRNVILDPIANIS